MPVSERIAHAGVVLHEVWSTFEAPAVISAEVETDPAAGEMSLPPPRSGTKIRISEFQPDSLDAAGLQSPIHRTETIDYGVVLEGEIVLVLDDSDVLLRAGDIVIQRGTSHAWANRGDCVAKVAFVMVDGTFEPVLSQAISPAGGQPTGPTP